MTLLPESFCLLPRLCQERFGLSIRLGNDILVISLTLTVTGFLCFTFKVGGLSLNRGLGGFYSFARSSNLPGNCYFGLPNLIQRF